MDRDARRIQEKYYAETAAEYDSMHGDEPTHEFALAWISAFLEPLGVRSLLDVGCGTGRGLKHFAAMHPGVEVLGVEPNQALIEQAVASGIDPDAIVHANGERLPFGDASFDFVCELAVLHHVRRPDDVVSEMLRVARRGVFLSDTNRFGHGPRSARLAKLALAKTGLWPLANRVKTKGRGYRLSAGDGVSYSYSVYDSFKLLARWADRVILVPTGTERAVSWLHPLLTTSHVLACALKE